MGCGDDGVSPKTGDNCWRDDNASLMLNGHATELVKDATTGAWHPKSDDGSKVEKLTGATNGDNDGEYWRVTTQDGTQYYFGLNKRYAGDPAHQEESAGPAECRPFARSGGGPDEGEAEDDRADEGPVPPAQAVGQVPAPEQRRHRHGRGHGRLDHEHGQGSEPDEGQGESERVQPEAEEEQRLP